MYVTENSMGLCIVLENTGDIAKVLIAFTDLNNKVMDKRTYIPPKVLEALEEELAA